MWVKFPIFKRYFIEPGQIFEQKSAAVYTTALFVLKGFKLILNPDVNFIFIKQPAYAPANEHIAYGKQ